MKFVLSINPVYHRIFFTCLIACCLNLSEAQDQPGIAVSPGAGDRFASIPGKLLTLGFRVTHSGSSTSSIHPRLLLPSDWRALVRESPFVLDPGQSSVRLLSISIPSTAAPGEYPVRYTISDPDSGTLVAEATVIIEVVAVRKLEIRAIESPRFIVAGEEYRSVFMVTNKGNGRSRIRLAARSSVGFNATPDSALIQLEARESRTIVVRVNTNRDLPEKVQDVLEISAELDGDSSAVGRAGSVVEIIPRLTSQSGDRFFEFPVWTKVRMVSEGSKFGSQVEIAGSSRLTETGLERLELSIRTPDIQSTSILGQRDEYRLTLRGVGYELYAGDRNFQLSPLTEFGRYAFGVGGKGTWGNITSGAFINETRFFSPTLKQQGAFVQYHAGSVGVFGVNYLHQNEPAGEGNVISVRSVSSPFSLSELDVEYGRSGWNGVSDDALSLRISGSERWGAYEARYIDAGPKYRGYFRDLRLKALTLGFEPWKHFRVEGYVRDEERNISRDTLLASAPEDTYFQVGVGYQDRVSVSFRSGRQRDDLSSAGVDRKEDAVQLRGGYSTSEFNLILNLETGTQHDLLARSNNPFERYSMFSNLRVGQRMSYTLSLEYSKEKFAFAEEEQKRLSYSMGGVFFLGTGTQVSVTYFSSRITSSVTQTYRLLDVSVDHVFPWGHKGAARVRHNAFTPLRIENETSYMLEYALPIGIPISRTRRSGILKGKVLDVETGRGIEQVPVYAGSVVTATDKEGYFSFPSLKPDKYYLFIDKASIGLNRVPTQPLPREVEVRGGEDIDFDIGVTRSGTVAGMVRLFAFAEGVSDTGAVRYDERGGHQGAVLELSNGTEFQRRVTDNRGRFVFTDVRPGSWSVTVVDGNLPEYHFVEQEVQHTDVKPAETKELGFRVLPRRRRIQILQQGNLLEAVKPAGGERKQCLVVPAREGPGFAIVLASWTRENDVRTALREAERLTGRKGTVERTSATEFRIFFGGFKSREEANKVCPQLQSLK